MTSQEILLSRNDVSNDDGGTEWEYDVLIVWVKDKTGVDFAYISFESQKWSKG